MRATEHPHNSDEQVRDYLQAALALVDELEPPDDLRVVCFVKAAELLASKQIFYEQAAPLTALPHLPVR
jgi:hypothetical protein